MDPVSTGTSAAAEHTESGERIQWPKNSIFHAPAHIRSGRESYFEPKLVSVGPYYHGREDLKHMEDLKLRCIPEIPVKQAAGVRNPPRSGNLGIPRRRQSIYNVPVEPSMKDPPRGLDDVPVEPFKNSGGIARAYYQQQFDQSPDNFVRMLVLDSCFIIRIVLALYQPVQESMAFLYVDIKEMPRLKIDSRQTTILVNLIAFENSILPSMRTFSSYMKLMDALIDSKKDVKFLQKCGVIDNTLGSHEMATTFFNDIGMFCLVDSNENHFPGLYKDVQKHYGSRWGRRRAKLLHDYFNTPWAIISFETSLILFAYTIFQTIYSVLGYYASKK